MRLDVKMKSGGPWNLRGTRPNARATGRDAARSSMSVGEWLDTVVDPTEPQHDNAPRPDDNEGRRADRARRQSEEDFRDRNARRQMDSSRRERDDRDDETRRESPRDDEVSQFEPRPDRAPQHRADESDGPQWRPVASGDARTRRRDRRSALYDREIGELQRQFGPGGGRRDERDRDLVSAERDRGDDVPWPARGQNQDRTRSDVRPAAHRARDFEDDGESDLPAPERQPSEAGDRWSSPAREVPSPDHDRPADRDSDRPGRQPVSSRRPRDEEARAERQRREGELFERAAVAAAEQRRQSSIDQAVAEIAARQRALDQDRAIEPRESAPTWGVDTAAMAAPPSKAPPQAPQPEVRHD